MSVHGVCECHERECSGEATQEMLSWFLFMRTDSVLVGDLTPPVILQLVREFYSTPEDKIKEMILEEFREEDLPECLKGSSDE